MSVRKVRGSLPLLQDPPPDHGGKNAIGGGNTMATVLLAGMVAAGTPEARLSVLPADPDFDKGMEQLGLGDWNAPVLEVPKTPSRLPGNLRRALAWARNSRPEIIGWPPEAILDEYLFGD